jgi:lycopene elongase/hydratase (dihydrobisanhydrobacterioruberin-forming)
LSITQKQSLSYLLRISRPRFWVYLLGPYLVGALAGGLQSKSVGWSSIAMLALGAVYFTFSANLLIYGVNDIFDYETDKHNPKKTDYEQLLSPEQRPMIVRAILITSIPLAILFVSLVLSRQSAILPTVGFLFFGVFYSAPPIRAKVRPLVDTLFNSLYVFPGVVGYYITSFQSNLSLGWASYYSFWAAVLWCMAMHAYSAVPDIASDKKAKISTIATWLGSQNTLLFCSACYMFAGLLSSSYLGYFSVLATIVYLSMIYLSIKVKGQEFFRLYKAFPLLNMSVGFVMFWYIYFAH